MICQCRDLVRGPIGNVVAYGYSPVRPEYHTVLVNASYNRRSSVRGLCAFRPAMADAPVVAHFL